MYQKHKRFILIVGVFSIVAGVGVTLEYAKPLATAAVSYKAKILCSGVFVSRREPQAVITQDLTVAGLEPLRFINAVVDKERHSVTADALGIVHQSAVFRPGLGCTLVFNGYPRLPASQAHTHSAGMSRNGAFQTFSSPSGVSSGPVSWSPPELSNAFDLPRLNAALDWAFSEPDINNPRRTRAVVILYEGKIAAEKYAAGFDRDTPLIGWSMTKSVVNALVGILVKQGKLDIEKPAPVAAWQSLDDPRRKITVNDLMHMVSGLQFVENYNDTMSDVTRMLFDVGDSAAFAAAKPLVSAPGSHWRYSSGSPVLICRIIGDIVGEKAIFDFPRQALFSPLGMSSAIMEVDSAGTLMGSSFMYATPRDWARFGQLYAQDGIWEGQRILPAGWVKYTTTPVPVSPDDEYGSYFWLKLPREFRGADNEYILPKDAFHAAGYDGQLLSIIPSRKLVIVRMGMTRYPVVWPQDIFVSKILDAMKRQGND